MLTPQQLQVLQVIEASFARAGVAPTVREILAQTKRGGIGMVHATLQDLEERGFIRRMPGRARAIELLRPSATSRDLLLRAFTTEELRDELARRAAADGIIGEGTNA